MKHTPAITGRALGYRCFQVLNYVNACIESEGIAPSYDMICDEFGISSRAKVSEIITRLEKRGLVSRVGRYKVPNSRDGRRVRSFLIPGHKIPEAPAPAPQEPKPSKVPAGMIGLSAAAKILNVGERWLRDSLNRADGIKHHVIGGRIYFDPSELDRAEVGKIRRSNRARRHFWLAA